MLLVREYLRDLPIAGSRMALRLDTSGALRQVVGRAMRAERPLPSASLAGADMWWPVDAGLVPVRIEDDPVHHVGGHPQQMRRAVRVSDGVEIAAWSILDEADLPIRGWREDPVTTPDGEDFMVEVFDASPPLLENDFIRVVECSWDEAEMTCAPEFGMAGDPVTGWTADLPALNDEAAHSDRHDNWAGPNSMQLAMRFLDKLEQWGWSREVWDVIDCEWQGVPDEECQLWLRVNVPAQDERGVFPFVGAYYSTASGIYMGQGFRSDTAFDGDVVVHEIGHHITRSYGTPEPTGLPVDRSRRFVDRQSINEGTSDFFARQMMSNDRIYDYFTTLEPGIYIGDRIRDVSIDFRCPENLTGETHMDGRIWVSALRDAQVQLAQEGLVSEDEFMATFLVALASIRQIPSETYEQFPPAIDILVDEMMLAHGVQAGAVVHGIFESRGLRSCHRTLDVRENPVVAGTYDPEDPLDARFIVLGSWGENTDPDIVFNSPGAPPLHHRVTLGPGESSLTLRYRVDLWRPAREDKETPPFRGSLLLKEGVSEISFWHDDETGYRAGLSYFWALAPNYDLTAGATYYSRQGFLGHAEWRHRPCTGP